ncbi:D-Ala-D-Ala carboxypeptidase family metallohydrolase [uncultured Hyphomicrobium sp.]|uniref:D-Ala-D-Ala carboxypeptidase family metallohydrolase n=1 Tax=uncultured Hyphomicrobium sp. TaxID=194373 RepID=UPI0025CD3A08|nr:D-Ala-D-Ala carboxypeptidase family metallohydrolase [uncultured Hyphomicrobium sp.]
MSKPIIAAVLAMGAAACLSAPAEARVDHGPISSLYENDGRASARPQRAKKQATARRTGTYRKSAKHRGTGKYAAGGKKKYASSGAKKQLAARAVTASHSGGGGGGASRGCLQASARALLDRIEAQFGPVNVISTCRPGARIAGSGKPSKHGFGLAVDFEAGGRKAAIVNWLRANHHAGGTMTYARMSHIHVDIGPRFVSLGAGGGRRKG